MLNGNDIKLRLIQHTDLSDLYEKWHDADIRGQYYPLALVPEPMFQYEFSKTGFWSENSKRLLIVDNSNDMLGAIHCFSVNNYSDSLEISYILFDVAKRNHGYTTQAVDLLVDYLFKQTRVNRIQLTIPIGNTASIRVAEKAHFNREGIARGAYFLDGEDVDLHVYALLRKEWQGCH
jgi:ribosomal-protein-alanine N-acetyltransferase